MNTASMADLLYKIKVAKGTLIFHPKSVLFYHKEESTKTLQFKKINKAHIQDSNKQAFGVALKINY